MTIRGKVISYLLILGPVFLLISIVAGLIPKQNLYIVIPIYIASVIMLERGLYGLLIQFDWFKEIKRNRLLRLFWSVIVYAVFVLVLIDVLALFRDGQSWDATKWDDVMVEFHGFLLDIIFFGLVVTFIRVVVTDKEDKIERWKEELNDYRGWDEKEAAYRVAGLIRRLTEVGAIDVNYENLHLGRCKKAFVVQQIKSKATIVSLTGTDLSSTNLYKVDLGYARLDGANLKAANLEKADLFSAHLNEADFSEANLKRADLSFVHLDKTNLQFAILDDTTVHLPNWIEMLYEWECLGADWIAEHYYVHQEPDLLGNYLIKKRNQ